MPIVNMRTFSQEELLILLSECAHHLGNAYQQTLDCALRDASYDAKMACEFLQFEIAVQHNYSFH